jgi:signal transduction histidine kinase
MGKGLNASKTAAGIGDKWRPSLAMVIGGVLSIVLTLPLAGMAAVVALSRSPESLLESLANNIGRILSAGLVIVAVTALVGYLFWRLVSRPIRELVDWTESVASRPEQPSIQAEHHGTRELARLAASFGDMVARLRDRSDYIATFTAHVSHELKSPLTSIAGAAELMRDAGDEMDARAREQFLRNIETDTVRLSALVARMRDLARAEAVFAGGSSRLPDILPRLRERFPALAIEMSGDAGKLPMASEDVLVVLSHLADNAVAHGALHLAIRTDVADGEYLIEVSNDGDPISAGNRAGLFEPFYTTRRESGGTGMGLAIVRAMLKAYGGDIALDAARPDVTFRVVLPA